MAKIEWTDRSDWNPIRGCTRASEGCRNCYAEAIAARFSDPGQPFHGFAERTANGPRWTGKVALIEERLLLPLRWKKAARIFVNSASDLFHESVPDEWIDHAFAIMALCRWHAFQVLTKRAVRMREYMAHAEREARWMNAVADIFEVTPWTLDGRYPVMGQRAPWLPLPNCWLGVSAEDQPRADERIPYLLATPAAVRFVSAEPLLAEIDFTAIKCPNNCIPPHYCNCCYPDGHKATGTFDALATGEIHQIITGGESGPGARITPHGAFESIRDQCAAAGVAYFHKQNGEFIWSAGEPIRIGKARAGRLLDGIEHNDMPAGARP